MISTEKKNSRWQRWYSKPHSKEIVKAATRRYRSSAKGRLQRKRDNFKQKYGITLEQYDYMFLAQEGLCAICHQPEAGKALSVDHDHVTGTVRKLLCEKCNRGLGSFDEDPVRLRAAADYLEAVK